MEQGIGPTLETQTPWNAGKMVGVKRALKEKHVWTIRFWLAHKDRIRDRALFDLALDSKLRGCDLVTLRIGDVVTSGQIRSRAMIGQQKTKRPVQFEITGTICESVRAWLEHRGGSLQDFIFPSRLSAKAHLMTRQYTRLLDEWMEAVGLIPGEYGTYPSPCPL